MERKRKLQRGAADLFSVAVGILVLAIAALGTSHALLYGRQALVNEEHYKVATYLLRGELEAEVAKIQLYEEFRPPSNPGYFLNFPPIYYDLDSPNDRDGEVALTSCVINREQVRWKDLISTGEGVDYYTVEMSAEWTDRAAAGSSAGRRSGNNDAGVHKITLVTSFVTQGLL